MNKKFESQGYYEVWIDGDFSASHYLRAYLKGKDEPMHGHNWKVQMCIRAPAVNRLGISVDFVLMRELLKQEIQHFDYKVINDLPTFRRVNPSSENVAKFLFDRLVARVKKEGGELVRVTAWETHHSGASYVKG